MKKPAPQGPGFTIYLAPIGGREIQNALLNLGFFEFHMLAHNRIIFAEAELLGRCARVLLGYIEKAGVSAAHKPDLHCGWLSHWPNPSKLLKNKATASAAPFQRASMRQSSLIVNIRWANKP